jgi:hypothetical protein
MNYKIRYGHALAAILVFGVAACIQENPGLVDADPPIHYACVNGALFVSVNHKGNYTQYIDPQTAKPVVCKTMAEVSMIEKETK